MKKVNQYLPFILWSISTIILAVLGLVIFPILVIREKLHSFFRKNELNRPKADHLVHPEAFRPRPVSPTHR